MVVTTVRAMRDEDAPAVAALLREAMPVEPHTTAGLRHWLATRAARDRPRAWVALDDGARVVGWAYAHATPTPPRTAWFWLGVARGARGRGVGARLYAEVTRHARESGAERLESVVTGDAAAAAFLERRGFERGEGETYWSVDPRRVDASGLDALRDAKEAEGYRVVPLSAVLDRERALHRAYAAIEGEDAAGEGPEADAAFEAWRAKRLQHPELDADASVLVLRGEEPVALAWLRVDPDARVAENAMTGTVPAHRRRGLARLAKLESLRRAAARGVERVWTSNADENSGMMALNRELGYGDPVAACAYARRVTDA